MENSVCTRLFSNPIWNHSCGFRTRVRDPNAHENIHSHDWRADGVNINGVCMCVCMNVRCARILDPNSAHIFGIATRFLYLCDESIYLCAYFVYVLLFYMHIGIIIRTVVTCMSDYRACGYCLICLQSCGAMSQLYFWGGFCLRESRTLRIWGQDC